MLMIYTFLIFTCLTLVGYILLHLIFHKEKSINRMEKYFEATKENKNDKDNESKIKIQPRKLLNNIGKKMNSVVIIKSYTHKIQKDLISAGFPLKGEEFLATQVLVSLIGTIFILNWTKSVLLILVGTILGWIIPKQILKIKKRKRYKEFNDQLGDAIVLISNSLKAGHSLLQAIDSVSREMPTPISNEFEKMLKEMKLGVTTEKALNNLLDRIESDDLELMIIAIMIQRQIGGNLSEILDNISNTIRQRIKIKGEVRTLTAQGRMSGIIVSLLPIGLAVMLYMMNPEYMQGLFTSTIGRIILGVAFINQIIGILVINKIVKIEV